MRKDYFTSDTHILKDDYARGKNREIRIRNDQSWKKPWLIKIQIKAVLDYEIQEGLEGFLDSGGS